MADNITIRNPLGNPEVYGEYDNVVLNTTDKNKVVYSKLPQIQEENEGNVLRVVDGKYVLGEQLPSNWTETDPESSAFILNKPFEFKEEVEKFADNVQLPLIYSEGDGCHSGTLSDMVDVSPLTSDKVKSIVVTWEGTEYRCTPARYADLAIIYGRNPYMSTPEDSFPFSLILMNNNGTYSGQIAAWEGDPAQTIQMFNVSVDINNEIVTRKLSTTFIEPVDYNSLLNKPFELKLPQVIADCIAQPTSIEEGAYILTTFQPVESNVPYRITINNSPFNIVLDEDYGAIIDNTMIFFITPTLGAIMMLQAEELPESVHVKIETVAPSVKKIDSMFLPKYVFGKLSEGDVVVPRAAYTATSEYEIDIPELDVNKIVPGAKYLVTLESHTETCYGGLLGDTPVIYLSKEQGLGLGQGVINNKFFSGIMSLAIPMFTPAQQHILEVTVAEDFIGKIPLECIPEDFNGLPKVTAEDNNKVLTAIDGSWVPQSVGSSLPEVTAGDAGKFLRVSSTGAWIAETIPDAEGSEF